MSSKRLAGFVAAAALVLAAPAAADSPTSFSDPVGDGTAAVDVSGVAVTNTGSAITLTISIAGSLPADGDVGLLIDSDRNTGTGDELGFDYVLAVGGDRSFDFEHWNGSDYAPFSHGAVGVLFPANGVTIVLQAADLGGVAAFDFVAVGVRGDELDLAPDAGRWSYQLAAAKPEIESAAARFAPEAPKAGARFSVAAVAVRLSNGDRVAPDSVTCKATLGGVRIRGTGAGGCSWQLSRRARGKRLVVTITATYGGATETFDPWVFTVR